MAAGFVGMAFIPYYKHLMDILETNAELRKTSRGIFKQMAYSAGGACVGGLVGGPPGAMLGGIAGSIVGYYKSDNYDSMLKVLQNLSDMEKEELVKKIQEVVGSSSIEALTSFIGSQVKREMLIHVIREFMGNKAGG